MDGKELEQEFRQYAKQALEWESSLMSWTEPQYNKSAVGKAGKELISPTSPEQYAKSLEILSNWRGSHAYPLNSIQNSLRSKACKISEEAIISQRLKRAESIKKKLERSPKMQLHRMQDIGGCRAIMPSIEQVYELLERMKNERPLRSENLEAREKDYILSPKDSGYRGIHMIYRYKKQGGSVYDGLLIEVQLRSAIQHSWATSVEIAGTFLGESLKSGCGSDEWLTFFRLTSTLFSALEGYNSSLGQEKLAEIRREVRNLCTKLSIVEKLQAFSVVTSKTDSEIKGGYFLLKLDIDKRLVNVKHYPTKRLEAATAAYTKLEEESKNMNMNVVLVAVESLATLVKSYPNYFAESKIFIETLNEALQG